MPAKHIDLPQGTLDLLILKTLALEPQHGWAISERVQQISSDVLRLQQGSLYPALHRLERRGWIKSRWGTSENNRKAKYYELTATGLKQLEAEESAWRKLAAAIARSSSRISICTSFSASAKVCCVTTGPVCGAVPNAVGAPGVDGVIGLPGWAVCASWPRHASAAASRPSGARMRNCRRVFTPANVHP